MGEAAVVEAVGETVGLATGGVVGEAVGDVVGLCSGALVGSYIGASFRAVIYAEVIALHRVLITEGEIVGTCAGEGVLHLHLFVIFFGRLDLSHLFSRIFLFSLLSFFSSLTTFESFVLLLLALEDVEVVVHVAECATCNAPLGTIIH